MKKLLDKQQFIHLWDQFRASYWFIPVCLMSLCCAITYVFITLIDRTNLPDLVKGLAPIISQDAARQLLSSIATSIITATSIAFSMTIVALTMASSQFGPRLLRTFMLDRATQWILGMLLSSFLFCLLAMHQISGFAEHEEARALLVGTAMLAVLVDIFAIIYFLHHIARFIQADQVIHRSYADFKSSLDRLFPTPKDDDNILPTSPELTCDTEFTHSVCATKCGYIRFIDYHKLLEIHTDLIAGVEVHARSGDHVYPGHRLMTVHANLPLTDIMLADFNQYVLIGSSRTPLQDVEFAVAQLVELALRALSPGINDPFTAMACLDKLTSACVLVSTLTFPANCVVNTQSNIWLRRRTFTLKGVINTAFDQIRQASCGHVDVIIYQLRCLAILQKALSPDNHPVLQQHREAIYQLCEAETLSSKDRLDIDEAYALAG